MLVTTGAWRTLLRRDPHLDWQADRVASGHRAVPYLHINPIDWPWKGSYITHELRNLKFLLNPHHRFGLQVFSSPAAQLETAVKQPFIQFL